MAPRRAKIFKIIRNQNKLHPISFNFGERVSRDRSSIMRLEIQHYSRNDNSTSDGEIWALRRYNPRNNDDQVNTINKDFSMCLE